MRDKKIRLTIQNLQDNAVAGQGKTFYTTKIQKPEDEVIVYGFESPQQIAQDKILGSYKKVGKVWYLKCKTGWQVASKPRYWRPL